MQVKGKTRGVRIYQVFTRNELVDGLDSYISRFQEARQLLNIIQLHQSLEAFRDLKNDWQTDSVTNIFYHRLHAYIKDPGLFEREYRDGVYICTDK